MAKTSIVDVNPNVLQWAVNTAGWEKKELVKALNIREAIYDGWIDGTTEPTIRQLKLLANKLKRPLAAFFLPEPPKEDPLPKDHGFR